MQVPDNDPDVQKCSRVAPGSHTKLQKVFCSFSMDISRHFKGSSSTFHDFEANSCLLNRSKTTQHSTIVSFAFVCPLWCNYLFCFLFGHDLFVPNLSVFSGCTPLEALESSVQRSRNIPFSRDFLSKMYFYIFLVFRRPISGQFHTKAVELCSIYIVRLVIIFCSIERIEAIQEGQQTNFSCDISTIFTRGEIAFGIQGLRSMQLPWFPSRLLSSADFNKVTPNGKVRRE